LTDPGISIREERPTDCQAIAAVNRAAFAGDFEANLVAELRANGDAVLSLVAETDGRIAGHIFFSTLPIESEGEAIPAVALAPIAVLPAYQRQGIGAALVRNGLNLCRGRGVPMVVVLGDPAWYTRFGFRAESARGLRTPWPGPHLMAIELASGALGSGHGIARYPAAFSRLEG
jgi:putative acetyltransferase